MAVSSTVYAASLIDEITIPITGANYDTSNGFTVSGRPNGIASIFYNDNRAPNPETNDFVIFDLSAIGLNGVVSPDGSEINYTSSGSLGSMSLLDGNNSFSTLLQGELTSLTLTTIDPSIGAFEGAGDFNVTGGSLAKDFGKIGGVKLIGISFRVPTTFNTNFAALANTKLFPQTPVPLPNAAWAGLLTVGVLSIYRKELCRTLGI